MDAEIGVFGGTGIYQSGILGDTCQVSVKTPYGEPSGDITLGTFEGRRIAFMPRHGPDHSIPPHMINYRANIWAFQSLGVGRIIAPSAVGSLREQIAPGSLALPGQFIDNTRTRVGSFTEPGRVIHISVAEPFCPQLRGCVRGVHPDIHDNCTYVCIEGPRFSTRAESHMYRQLGADIIGMTLVPECQLAREAQICYVSVSLVTDYDVWAEKPVTAREVTATVSANARSFMLLLKELIRAIPARRNCQCATALGEASL